MLELIGNLLDNGCKFGASKVQLRLSLAAEMAKISLRDNGPGVAPELRERLLERGNRIDESIEGHGLGLSICQMIVESYQGQIDFPALAGEEEDGFLVEIKLPMDSPRIE